MSANIVYGILWDDIFNDEAVIWSNFDLLETICGMKFSHIPMKFTVHLTSQI